MEMESRAAESFREGQGTDILVHFNPNLKLVLANKSLNYGIGPVLSHEMPDGTECPIGYVSLNPTGPNY